MTIEEILQEEDLTKRIDLLKGGRLSDPPDVENFKDAWNPKKHRTIVDKGYLPDRSVQREDGTMRIQKVNRLAIPFQKKIVNTAVSFAFSNPVKLIASPDGNDEELIYQGVQRLDHDCKLKAFNRKVFRELLRSTEVAELWYVVEEGQAHERYGFSTEFKIRVASFRPFAGDELFPYFDSTGDMVAFSRAFSRKDEKGKSQSYFETYTETKHWLWVNDDGWKEAQPVQTIQWGKIPVIYMSQEAVEWIDVEMCIERLEYLLSKFGDTNDYHASPKIFLQGRIESFVQKGDPGGIIQGSPGASAEYLSWNHAPESVKLEIETLLRFIFGMTQTPDISFDSVKGLNQISGQSLKMLFMDAHLKVEEKREFLDEYLQRRINLQKRILGVLSNKRKASENLQIEPEISPFIIEDESTLINNLVTANGGMPIISQRTAINKLGWVDDTNEEIEDIESEASKRNSFSLFEPTNS